VYVRNNKNKQDIREKLELRTKEWIVLSSNLTETPQIENSEFKQCTTSSCSFLEDFKMEQGRMLV